MRESKMNVLESLYDDNTMILTKVKDNVYVTSDKFTPKLCEIYSDHIFVFGDNDERFGMGGQAIIRKCNNSIGLRTKKAPHHSDTAFYTDEDFRDNKQKIDEDLSKIEEMMNRGVKIVFSSNGYGNGLAELPTRAPKTYQYLIETLKNKFGVVNE